MRHILDALDYAIIASHSSPCQSKRGVAVFNGEIVISCGCNHQPEPFACDGSDGCKQHCGRTAVHAEQQAILNADRFALQGSSLIHVKTVDGKVVASGAPSCLECSKLILAAGIAKVYLVHDFFAQLPPGARVVAAFEGLQIREYSAAQFHWLTADGWHRLPLLLRNAGAVEVSRG